MVPFSASARNPAGVLEPLESSPIARDFAILSGGLIGLVTFYKTVLVPLFTAAKKLGQIYEGMQRVQYEFKPNGGSSLRDAINRLELGLGEIRHAQQVGQERLKAIVADNANGYFETDKDGQWFWANHTALSLTKRPMCDLIGNGWINAVIEGDRADVYERYSSAIQQERDFESVVFFQSGENGAIPMFIRTHPLRDKSNTISGYFGIIKSMEKNVTGKI